LGKIIILTALNTRPIKAFGGWGSSFSSAVKGEKEKYLKDPGLAT
jgi:hypothetical protein